MGRKRKGDRLKDLVLRVVDRLGVELGRPPSTEEIWEAVVAECKAQGMYLSQRSEVSRALGHLKEDGFIERVGRCHHVQTMTPDGQKVNWY